MIVLNKFRESLYFAQPNQPHIPCLYSSTLMPFTLFSREAPLQKFFLILFLIKV